MIIERDIRNIKLTRLRPVLKKWQDLMVILAHKWGKEDVPWWYNERPWVGLLSAAAWKTKGGWAFEEYSDKKIFLTRKRKQVKKPGRVDLLIGNSSREYLIEAKHVDVNLGGDKGLSIVLKALKATRSDTSHLRAYKGQEKIYMVCITPYVLEVKGKDIDSLIEKFIRQLLGKTRTTVAWVFPKNMRQFPGGDGYLYPGAVLVLKYASRRR
jgi:hypothetical protein